MSSSTDPENLPPRRARENADGSGSYRAAADDDATRTFDRAPAADATPTSAYDRVPESRAGASGPSAERDYVPAASGSAVDPHLTDRQTAVAREKDRFGGIKVGSAFFGWLTATGMAVLLTALVAAAGTAVGLATNTDVNEAVNQAASNTGTVGLVGIIVLLVILLLSYYCGGYVAGRMARFNGAKQGLMVWIWALIVAVLIAILGLVAGQQFNVLANLNSFPRIPVNEGQLTTTSIIAAVVVALVALAGAVLGGLAGMRFHRKVDRAGFTPDQDYNE
ncbi:hypothetical protein [Arthrobacter sp. Z4-13]